MKGLQILNRIFGKGHFLILLVNRQLQLHLLIGIVISTLLCSCNVNRFLKEDELLLKGNDIKFQDAKHIENHRTLKYELSTLYKQKPNTRFFFFPREWFWFATRDANDTTALDRFQQKVIAEPPAIYDEKLTENTAKDMQYYLQYKGYYKAHVFAESNVKGKKNYVTYYVSAKQRHSIDSVFYESTDTTINRLVQGIKAQSLLKKGNGLDLAVYEQEKERITKYLRNNGYAYFYANYFKTPLTLDTFQQAGKANLYLTIEPPFGEASHTAYFVGEIEIYPSYDPVKATELLRDTLINGYVFRVDDAGFDVKPQVILDAVYLTPGSVYSQDLFDKTNRQLSALGVFRFVRIRQEIDSLRPRQINFRIELTPNSKMEFGADFEINYTNRSTSSGTGNLLGFTINPSLRNRNLLGGAELLVTNLSAGVEVNPNFNDARFWNTVDLRLQTDFYFPKFLDYFNFWKGLHDIPLSKKKRLISSDFYQALRESSSTKLSASYNYISVLGWYRYDLVNATYGYDLQRSNTSRFFINHIGIDYLRPVTLPKFEELLSFNTFLKQSFGEQFFVSLLFRDLNFVFSNRQNRYGESQYGSIELEMAGAEIWAVNALYNEFALSPTIFKLGQSNFSQYIKLELDGRYYRQFNSRQSFALRANIGIARPFGYTTDVPYIKQFYAGGPNSIRAWAPRGLGPGGYSDPLSFDPSNNLRLYQTGDLKMEINAEYRFDVFWRLKGAFFLDAGNIWTLTRDTQRVGSQFLLARRTYPGCETGTCYNDAFYRQIAVGGGFGLRIDFTYFIFRTDMGVKLRNSFPRVQGDRVPESSYWSDFKGWGLRDVTFNLGFGYPF